jgi:protein-tyrosine phosphatase
MSNPVRHARIELGVAATLRINYGTWRGWVRHLLGLAALRAGCVSPFLRADPCQARRLVFVCLGNINRSAFAGVVAQRLGEASVTSIGLSTTTGAAATPEAVHQARLQGFELSAHRATALADYTYQVGDLLLVMELRHAHALVRHGIPAVAVLPLGLWATPRRVHLHDPHTLSAEYFSTCFTLIESAVRRLVELRREGRP